MQTIFYRCESAAARQKAESLGLDYPGRQRLNVMHVGAGTKGMAKAVKVIKAIRDESDYFWGYSQSQLGSKGF